MILEACVETFEEALNAERNGANRIELCANLKIGGTTPSYALVESTRLRINIPIMVMVRPRGGDFVYDDTDIRLMKQTIEMFKMLDVQGVVFGLLDRQFQVDENNTKLLIEHAYPLEVTFHKAVDETADLLKATETLSEIKGLTRILTSGGKTTALEGVDVINEMILSANGRIKILAAGRITHTNLTEISTLIHTDEFHGRKIVGKLS